jgi:hypothetical protein
LLSLLLFLGYTYPKLLLKSLASTTTDTSLFTEIGNNARVSKKQRVIDCLAAINVSLFLATPSPLDLCMLVLHPDEHLDIYGMNN